MVCLHNFQPLYSGCSCSKSTVALNYSLKEMYDMYIARKFTVQLARVRVVY